MLTLFVGRHPVQIVSHPVVLLPICALQDFGALPGTQLPRLLDMGQCNDSYSALVVAMKLAEVFNTDVNGLPLSLDISW